MWSSDRRGLLAGGLAAALLAGCGFTPAYAPGGVGTRLRNQIHVAAPRNAQDYLFAVRMTEQIGQNEAGPLELDYNIATTTDSLAITPEQAILRYHLRGTLEYTVKDTASGRELSSGSIRNFTSYSAIGTTVATRASFNSAEERLMVILADDLYARLLATGETWLP